MHAYVHTNLMFHCSVYWPPKLPLGKFIEELKKELAKIPEKAEIVQILGDFTRSKYSDLGEFEMIWHKKL